MIVGVEIVVVVVVVEEEDDLPEEEEDMDVSIAAAISNFMVLSNFGYFGGPICISNCFGPSVEVC